MVLIRVLSLYTFVAACVLWGVLRVLGRWIKTIVARRYAALTVISSLTVMSVIRVPDVIADGDTWDMIATLGPVVLMVVYALRTHFTVADLRAEWKPHGAEPTVNVRSSRPAVDPLDGEF